MSSSVNISAGGVQSVVVSTAPCGLIRVQGEYIGASDGFLQIHNAQTVAQCDATTMVKSYKQASASAFSWAFDPNELMLSKGLVVLFSSARAAVTLNAAYVGNFEVEFEPSQAKPSDMSVAGDLTTAQSSVQVWNAAGNATNIKKLYQVDYSNGTGGAAWLMVFNKDNPVNGDKPIFQQATVDSQVLELNFGDGLQPLSCTIVESQQANTLNAWSGTFSTIRAFYK